MPSGEKSMILGERTVPDTATREELLKHIKALEDEIVALETLVQEKQGEIEDLSLTPEQLNRLEDAAEWAVELGIIHGTPAAKRNWIDGK